MCHKNVISKFVSSQILNIGCVVSYMFRDQATIDHDSRGMFCYIPRQFKKCGVLCLYLPFKKLCSSVRPSVSASFSLLGALFNQFSSNLLRELILGRSVLGLQMGKF